MPTSDVAELTAEAKRLLARVYRPGFAYKKAGVDLLELTEAGQRQTGLFDTLDRPARSRLMEAYDAINAKHGSGAIRTAAQSFEAKGWHMRREHLSPAYTTRWDELPVAGA